MRHRRHVLARTAPIVAVAGLLAACGGGGEPTVEVRGNATSTTFVTLPPPSSTTAPPSTVPPSGQSGQSGGDGRSDEPDEPEEEIDPVTGNRLYTVQRNDYLLRIATRFDVTPQEIADANGWSSIQHNINPGDQIQIPPANDPADTDADGDNGDDNGTGGPDGSEPASSDPSGTECADGSEPETYRIQRGDIPARVARRFDVTVEELAEANAATPGYRNFIVGTEITIPC